MIIRNVIKCNLKRIIIYDTVLCDNEMKSFSINPETKKTRLSYRTLSALLRGYSFYNLNLVREAPWKEHTSAL